jgi:cell division protease FtsH
VHARGKPLDPSVDLTIIARRTPGFTGADLENVINESALLAARREKAMVTMSEVDEAIDRVMAGPEKKTRVMSVRERRMIAYHELGHAIVAHALPNTDEVHKISVIPRGRALGYTLTLPEEDKFLMTREELKDELAMMLGGRVAEEIMVGDVTTGAANDIERATKVARQMVTEYGMSDDLGPLTLGQKTGEVFLGRDFSSHPDYSEQVAFEIDNEVRRLIDEAHDMALEILGENQENLDRWADVLIDKETIDKAQIEELFASVRKHAQRDPEKRSAGLAVSRTAVREHKSRGPSGLRG